MTSLLMIDSVLKTFSELQLKTKLVFHFLYIYIKQTLLSQVTYITYIYFLFFLFFCKPCVTLKSVKVLDKHGVLLTSQEASGLLQVHELLQSFLIVLSENKKFVPQV